LLDPRGRGYTVVYVNGWCVDAVVDDIIVVRGLEKFVVRLTDHQWRVLVKSLGDHSAYYE